MVYLRLPKPPGLGVFALAMERTWGRARGINPTSGERGDPLAFKGAIKSALEQLTPGISVAMLRPLIEVGANYDFFRDRPIVDQWEQALPAEEQGADRSSEFARIVGRIFDVPPAATDHLIAGYTAGLGKAGLQLADPVLRTVAPEGTTPPREPMRFDDYLLVKNFLAGTTRREHEALRRFYDEWDEVRAVRRRLAQLEVDPAREAAYRESHLPELKKYRVLSSAAERIGRLGKRRRAILAAPRNDPMELDRALRENLDAMIETARAAYGAMPGDAE